MNSLASISLIYLKDLQRFNRLDAEYYQQIYLEYLERLKKLGSIRLGDPNYAKITDGIHTAIDYDPKSNIRCLSATSPRQGYFDLSANNFISTKQHNRNLRSSMREGDVIISSVGTIGNCAVITNELLPTNADRDVGIIRIKNNKLNPFFVCAFLNSKYGLFQTKRESTGNVQLHLFIDKMKEILIPLISTSIQEQIGRSVKESTILYFQAEEKFKKSIETLLEFAKFKEPQKETLTYTADSNAVIENNRIDAEFYHPKYEQLLQQIKKFENGYSSLIDKFPLSNSKIQPQKQPEKKFTYVELSDVNGSIGMIDEKNIVLGRNAPSRAQMSLKKNDVIVSSVSGSFDKVALISDEFNESVGSSGFFVFRPKNGFSEFLLVLVKSPLVQLQLQKYTTGSILSAVPKPIIKKIQIPDFPLDKQKIIVNIVKESHRMFTKSKNLMRDAIAKVENIIED